MATVSGTVNLVAASTLTATASNKAIVANATASTVLGAEVADHAFDGIWASYWHSESTMPTWLEVQLTAPAVVSAVTIVNYNYSTARTPNSFLIQGSNNNTDWDTLDTRTGVTWASMDLPKTFAFANTTEYLYYRIYITASNGDDYMTMRQVDFWLDPHLAGATALTAASTLSVAGTVGANIVNLVVASTLTATADLTNHLASVNLASTSYLADSRIPMSSDSTLTVTATNTVRATVETLAAVSDLSSGGMVGVRVPISAATASTWYGSEPPANAIDGNPASHFTTNGTAPPHWWRGQLSSPARVNQYSIRARDDLPLRNPKDFTFEGSDNGTSWTTLDTHVGVLWTPGETKSFNFTNLSKYLYYRVYITAAGDGNDGYTSIADITFADTSNYLAVLTSASTLTATAFRGQFATATLRGAATLLPAGTVIGGIITAYWGEPSDVLIPVALVGSLTADLPAPVPPVDADPIADPSVAPTLSKANTAGGHLLPGTYTYAYAAWVGSAGQASAPSPWSAPVTLTTDDTITVTYPTVTGADGYVVYRDDGTGPVAVDVAVTVVGSVVTSVDTGVPVGSYPADGSQTDPLTNVPYDPGTPLVNNPIMGTVPAGSNQVYSPIITLNSTQTWVVATQPLIRNSLVFNRPTEFGRFHQAINWLPVSETVSAWGNIQVVIGGIDVTYLRGHPAEMGPWSSNEPNGDAATSIYFPQISWWERPNYNDIAFIEGGKPVDIILIRPNGTRLTLFEGLVVGVGHDGQGLGITVNVVGVLYQADHTPYIQELYLKHRDIGTAIADIMDGAISRQYGLCNRPATGIFTNIRGSGGARLTGSVQDILSTAFVADTTNQWTITNLPGRKPSIQLKDKTTHHWTMAMGHPGLKLSIDNDFQQIVGMVWGSGVSPTGGSWFNAKYPGVRIDTVPTYPLGVGVVFVAGDSHTGFDEFADEMRTRGYTMASADTYSTQDVAEVKDMQKRAGITVDGVVGAQTWTTAFGVGGSVPSLDGAHIAPLAAIPWNVQFLENPDGSIIGPNPSYKSTFLAIGRYEEYGEGVTKKEGMAFAKAEIHGRIINDPMWVGSATLSMDPENGSRWEIKAGQNLFVKFMYAPLKMLGIEDGLLLHISQASVEPGGDVTVQLSYLGYDMTTLAAIAKRNKDTLDPARRGANNRMSRITQDSVIPWDEEAGGGKVPIHNLQGGFWLVVRIPGGQIGSISEVRYVCSTGAKATYIDTAFTTEAALSGGKEFAVAIFGKPVTANWLRDTVGNPLTEARTWTKKAAQLEKAGLIQAYGASDQPAGHWPGQGSESDPITGKMLDGSTWPWESQSPPYLWVAEYCPSSTKIVGQLRNAPNTAT